MLDQLLIASGPPTFNWRPECLPNWNFYSDFELNLQHCVWNKVLNFAFSSRLMDGFSVLVGLFWDAKKNPPVYVCVCDASLLSPSCFCTRRHHLISWFSALCNLNCKMLDYSVDWHCYLHISADVNLHNHMSQFHWLINYWFLLVFIGNTNKYRPCSQSLSLNV